MATNDYTASAEGIEMPFSFEAEQSVLGCALVFPETVTTILANLKSEYFYMPLHQTIMNEIVTLEALGSKIDIVIVLDRLKGVDGLDADTTKNYLFQLAQLVPSPANIETHCKIVKEKFYLRSLINISRETIDAVVAGENEADKILDSAEQKIYDIRKGKTTGSLQRLSNIIAGEVYPNLVNITSDNAEDFKGIPTGFSKIDEAISGLNRSDLVLIGARPAMGKTSFALNIARNVGMTGKKVLFFSLEMSNEQLAARVLSTEARVESNKLRSGELSAEEWTMLAQAADRLTKCNLYFDDTSSTTVPDIKAKIKREGNVDCILIDYLQLMESATRKENRVQEVTEITRGLKMLAKDMRIPVVCCCQLSRGPEKNGKASNRPMLSDLRDSGSIEQDADIVMMLYREGYYRKDGKDNAEEVDMTKADVDIAKNRHGPTDRINLHWEGQFTLFSTLEYRDE